MADNPQTLSAVLAALPQFFRGDIVRTINRRSVLLKILRVSRGRGKNVAWDWEGDGHVAESFNDGDVVSNFGSDALASASIAWGAVRANFRVGDIAAAAAASSEGGISEELLSLVGNNFVGSQTKLASLINGKLFNGTTDVIGLDTALRADNTYAGVDRTQAANAGFRSTLIDPGALTAPTLDQIRDDITVQIYRACGEQPDIAICSPEVFRKIGSLFEETRRRVDSITTPRGTITLDGSIGAIEFEGCVFFKDKDATQNTIYYLNSNWVEIEYLQQVASSAMPAMAIEMALNDGYGPIPLGMRCKKLGVKGASEDFTSQVLMQLKVRKPSACARRVNVATT